MYKENATIMKIVVPSNEIYKPTCYSDALAYLAECISNYHLAEKCAGEAFAASIKNDDEFCEAYGPMPDVVKEIENLKEQKKVNCDDAKTVQLLHILENVVNDYTTISKTYKNVQSANEDAMEKYKNFIIPRAIIALTENLNS